MKHVIALVLGLLVGAGLFAAGLLFNPFIADRGLSPVSVSKSEVIALNFANVPAESIAYTNDGESMQQPHPEKVLQLWEAPIRTTSAMTTVMRDARSRVAGIGVKFMSDSESTRLLQGDMIVDSVWYIYLPEHGSLFVQQTENYFPFVREVVLPAWRSSANGWRGNWRGDLSTGPGALGTARVIGGSGRVEGLTMDGVEAMAVEAFSLDKGLVSAEGSLLIELPASQVADDEAVDTP